MQDRAETISTVVTDGLSTENQLDEMIGFNLRRAQEMAFQSFASKVGDASLKPGLYTILSVLSENPGVNQMTLSQLSCRDKSTLTPIIRELETAGEIIRERSKTDRRAYCLYLTAAGKAHLDKLSTYAREHDRVLDEIVGEVQRPLFIFLLKRIQQHFDQN